MSREICGLCGWPYEQDGTCGCPEFAQNTNEPLMEDVEGFLTNQELKKLAKEVGIDPDDFLWELDWPKLRRFAFLVEKTACSKDYDKEEDNSRLVEQTHSPSGTQQSVPHPGITHCENCGCDWLDNGLNPIGCPYCK